LHTRWLGPYEIKHIFDNGAIQLKPINGERNTMLVNGNMLRLYNKLASKEELTTKI
jgi:hypothetical protein